MKPFDPSNLEKDCYFIQAIGKSSEFMKMFLVKNDSSWQWRGVLHEVISSSHPTSKELFDEGHLLYDEYSGNRAQNPDKYVDDAKVLEKALLENPDNPRYTFYLAQSYMHAKMFEKALTAYEKRVQLGGDAEEIFWSYYCIGCLRGNLNYPSSTIIQAFCKAYQYKPSQAEPLYQLAGHFGKHPFLGYLIAKFAKNIPLPRSAARLQGWIYEKIPKQFEHYAKEIGAIP